MIHPTYSKPKLSTSDDAWKLKSRAQSEEALSQDFEGESERRPRRRPSREADSRRSSTAVSADREETEQEADTKPEVEAKAAVDAAEAARDRAGGSSSAEEASSDQEARAGGGDRVEASRSTAEAARAASEADGGRDEEETKVEDGYGGREEAEPEGESRDYFREEGPYRLEVTEEEEHEESEVAQATSVAPVGKAGDVITAPSSQRTWKATGGGDRASRRSKYPNSVGQPQLQKQLQKQQQPSTRAPAATRGGASRKPAAAGGAKASPPTAMSVPEKVTGARSRKQSRGQSSGVTVQVAKVRLIPGRPAAEAGTAEAESEVSEIREYVKRGGERIRDDRGERDASRRVSRKAVNNVDTARTVVESYRKSDAAAAAAAKKPKRERTFDVEVYVTELGEAGTQTGGVAGASGKGVKERGSSSKGGGGGSGVRRRSRSNKSLSKSDTRGSLLGDMGHVRGDKGADTTDADASSLADSAGISQDNPSLEDHGGAERSEIELDRLDKERDIEDPGNGIDGNISADDEGSVDENKVERASALSEVPDPALDSGVDGDEIKPSVAELQSSANAPELMEKIRSAEQSEVDNDVVKPVTEDDAGKTKSSNESATSGEQDGISGQNAADKPAVADEPEHEVEPNEVGQSTGTPDQKQAEGDEVQGRVTAAPDKFDKTKCHVDTTDPNPEDMVTEPGDLHEIHAQEEKKEARGSDDQKDTVHSPNETEAIKEIEGDDAHKSIHKDQEIETRETNGDRSAVTNDEGKTLVGDENNAIEREAPLEERGHTPEEGSKRLDGDRNDAVNGIVDKKSEEPQDVLDKADSHAENECGNVTKVDDAVEGRPELDTDRNVSGVGTRPGTGVAAEATYSQGDKSHNERMVDGASGPTGDHADVEDGENQAGTPEAKVEHGDDMEGVLIEDVNNGSSDAALESREVRREENDIANATSDADEESKWERA
ncbi:hypothetical protein HPB49_000771 [Dermacentor silvarum]|uniref:Uncharacterized protein n=1 Tax=Dermacentor silvarum TaxID=543639 RepID=A0ACB8DHI9_DERSI|nr:hypothetical protein HPB49_000771 [Dermacentor silvarum]